MYLPIDWIFESNSWKKCGFGEGQVLVSRIFSTSLSQPDESCRLELNKCAAGSLGLTLLREAGVDSDICEDLWEKLFL